MFIQSAVRDTTYEVVSHHQWLTLAACVLMWGPSLLERLLAKWDVIKCERNKAVKTFFFAKKKIKK